ncbi:MAG: GntR family transcriptional regulator [Halanaerobiaceae bacterium]|nr:GntR family transcriptional regulator [Halanaerobiaceae bacterium]
MNFDAANPIYEQIIEEIKKMIVRGELNPGDKLPSQRDMAKYIEVNPNTIQRAYREMELLDLIETRRGKGTFVKEDDSMVITIRNDMARDAVSKFISEMKSLGYTGKEIIEYVKGEIEKKEEEKEGNGE